jgi:uncharacterized protein with HEPN domain
VVARSLIPRLTDIIEAIERVNGVLADVSLESFENDWQRQWLVERGVEIISEASRHLPDDLKARHPEIPWQKIAGTALNSPRMGFEPVGRIGGT